MTDPIAYLRDAHEGEGIPCYVPAAKGDEGAFPVYAARPPATEDEVERVARAIENSLIESRYVSAAYNARHEDAAAAMRDTARAALSAARPSREASDA